MARESEFVDKLSDFTKSLGDLVELLKTETKGSGGAEGGNEALNMMCETMDEKMTTVVSTLGEVKEDVLEIKKETGKITKAVQEIKQQKEKGVVGEVGEKKNQNKVIEGVKMIVLIAGAVLAIGMAFKLVGNVDIFSVIALGMGIMFTAMAFEKVASIKDDKGKPITFKKSLITAGIMLLMAASITAAGLLLSIIPILGPWELLTIVGIGLTMGLATYFMMKGVGKLSVKQIAMLPLVPLVIPVIALGIVIASMILQNVENIGMDKLKNALMVAIALAPIMIGFGYMMKGLKNAKASDLLIAGLAIPVYC